MKVINPFNIPKELVMQAQQLVQANKGSHGIDQQSLADFDKDWRGISINCGTEYLQEAISKIHEQGNNTKKTGWRRIIGIPTIEDCIVSTVVKMVLEPELEKYFTLTRMDIVQIVLYWTLCPIFGKDV